MQRQRALSTNSGDLREANNAFYVESSVEVDDYTSANNFSKNLNQNLNVRIEE